MQAFIDWLQFTYKVPDSCENSNEQILDEVIKGILCLNPAMFTECKGFYGYKSGKELNNVRVFYDGREDMGFHIQISGKGCRFLENQPGFEWKKLFALIVAFECNITRIDVAIDDKEYLSMSKIKWYLDRKQFVSRFKNYSIIEEKNLKTGNALGETIYLGRRVSDFFIRIYDKGLESDGKNNSIRLEFVMRNERANAFVAEYMAPENFYNMGYLSGKVINNYIRFVKERDANSTRSENADWWDSFIGTLEKVSLSVGKESVTVEQVCNWLERSVASSLKLIAEAKGYRYVDKIVYNAKLSDKHQKMLKEYKLAKTANE